jgi:hypothetical protein
MSKLFRVRRNPSSGYIGWARILTQKVIDIQGINHWFIAFFVTLVVVFLTEWT